MLGDFNKVLEDREHKQHSGIKVKEPLQTLRGKPPFTPYSAFTPDTPVFTHYTCPGGGIPRCEKHEKWIERLTEMDLKKFKKFKNSK